MNLIEAMTAYVSRTPGAPPGVTVTGYQEQGYHLGYCETCWDSQIVVQFECVDGEGERWTYFYADDLSGLIRELTKDPAELSATLDSAERYAWDEDEPPHADDLPFPRYSNTWVRGEIKLERSDR